MTDSANDQVCVLGVSVCVLGVSVCEMSVGTGSTGEDRSSEEGGRLQLGCQGRLSQQEL